jgi:hypothetical protein
MQYKPIENYHVENVVLGKDFNLGLISYLFMFSPLAPLIVMSPYGCKWDTMNQWDYWKKWLRILFDIYFFIWMNFITNVFATCYNKCL